MAAGSDTARGGTPAGGGRRGRLIILSAPSGAGKSTLCVRLRRRFADLRYSISYTTRSPRPGERDGVDYHFTSRRDFEDGIRGDRWAEWAEVHGNYYGTSADFIEACLQAGQSVLLDIDVQGTRTIRRRYPDCVTIFIAPPSMAVLEQRLRGRGTDDPDTIARRLKNAAGEMALQTAYDHVLVNDDLETAAAELIDLVARYVGGAGVQEALRTS